MILVLKDLRTDKGLSQKEVYNQTKIHMGRIESRINIPSISTLSVLLKFFNIRMSEFFQRIENMKL